MVKVVKALESKVVVVLGSRDTCAMYIGSRP